MPYNSHHDSPLRLVCPHCVRRQRHPTTMTPLYCYPWCRLPIAFDEKEGYRADYRLTA